MEFNFILTGLVLMLSFVTFSLSNRMNKYSNIYLTFLFSLLTLIFILHLMAEYFFDEKYGLDIIIESIKFLIPSLLYLCIYHFVNNSNHFLKKHYPLFIPSIIVAVILIFLNITETNRSFLESNYEIIDAFLLITLILFSVITFYLEIKMLLRHKKNILNIHSNIKGVSLNWIYNLILTFSLILIVHLFFEISSEDNYFTYFFNFILVISLLYAGYHIVQQRDIYDTYYHNTEIQKEKIIDKSLVLEIAKKLQHIMEEEKLFLNKDLSLTILSTKLNTTTHIMSYLINTHYNVNFYSYINKFRLDYSKSLLNNPNKKHLSIEGIAYESGFGSKSTFNTLFKKDTGTTPSQYKME